MYFLWFANANTHCAHFATLTLALCTLLQRYLFPCDAILREFDLKSSSTKKPVPRIEPASFGNKVRRLHHYTTARRLQFDPFDIVELVIGKMGKRSE